MLSKEEKREAGEGRNSASLYFFIAEREKKIKEVIERWKKQQL